LGRIPWVLKRKIGDQRLTIILWIRDDLQAQITEGPRVDRYDAKAGTKLVRAFVGRDLVTPEHREPILVPWADNGPVFNNRRAAKESLGLYLVLIIGVGPTSRQRAQKDAAAINQRQIRKLHHAREPAQPFRKHLGADVPVHHLRASRSLLVKIYRL